MYFFFLYEFLIPLWKYRQNKARDVIMECSIEMNTAHFAFSIDLALPTRLAYNKAAAKTAYPSISRESKQTKRSLRRASFLTDKERQATALPHLWEALLKEK
jgi:hypothetical protein